MRRLILVFLLVALTGVSARETATPGRDWPQFRGIGSSGVSEGASTPSAWNVPAGERVKWKTAIPGLGHSSPIVHGDLVCVSTALSGKPDPELKVGLYGDIKPVEDDSVHTWKVLCLDRKSGKVKWEQTAATGVPKIKRHTKATHANSTMATDGTHAGGVLRVGGLVRVRPEEGHAALEEGPRRPRLRVLHGAGGAVGLCQLAGDLRGSDHPAGGRAEGLVSRRVHAEGRP